MKPRSIKPESVLIISFSMILFSCSKTDEKLPNEPVPINLTTEQVSLIESENKFAFDIFSEVLNNTEENKNIIISPLSISIALSMTLNGADGATRDSMLKALRLSGTTPEAINKSYKLLSEELLSVDKRILISIANSVWTEDDFVVKQAFIDILTNYYNAESRSFDISDPTAPDKINLWVENKTNNLIKKMISQLDDNTVMILINAIYFKGKWKMEFDASKTLTQPFYKSDGSTADAQMMKQTQNFKAFKGDGFTIAEFPYGQGNYVMDVILPDNRDGLGSILSILNDNSFSTWINQLTNQKVDLSFPRFKFGFKKELKDVLTNMGMGIAFTDNANLSNISDLYDLYISFVTHQAFIETNEEGTEAAAATAVGFGVTSIPSYLVIDLNHPFIFIIREITTNSVIFMGKVADPSAN